MEAAMSKLDSAMRVAITTIGDRSAPASARAPRVIPKNTAGAPANNIPIVFRIIAPCYVIAARPARGRRALKLAVPLPLFESLNTAFKFGWRAARAAFAACAALLLPFLAAADSQLA